MLRCEFGAPQWVCQHRPPHVCTFAHWSRTWFAGDENQAFQENLLEHRSCKTYPLELSSEPNCSILSYEQCSKLLLVDDYFGEYSLTIANILVIIGDSNSQQGIAINQSGFNGQRDCRFSGRPEPTLRPAPHGGQLETTGTNERHEFLALGSMSFNSFKMFQPGNFRTWL